VTKGVLDGWIESRRGDCESQTDQREPPPIGLRFRRDTHPQQHRARAWRA
jgi:hypothetical protein